MAFEDHPEFAGATFDDYRHHRDPLHPDYEYYLEHGDEDEDD